MNDAERLTPRKSQRVYWLFQLTGWGLFTVSRLVAGVAILGIPWLRLGLELLFLNAAALALSHRLRAYMRGHRWSVLPFRKLSLRIIAAAFILGAPLGIVTQFTDLSMLQLAKYAPALSFQFTLPISLAAEIVNWACVFIVWSAIYFTAIAVREHRSAQLRQSELARALQSAELRLLKSQLNPHFLFNALNTVRSLIAENPARAQGAMTRLANTLRYTLSSRQDELVTLSQELDIVTDYLELESMRFEDRLRIETHIPEDAGRVLIPVMLLQILAENAIKHGIAELPEGGLLRISAALQDEVLTVEVENPRPATARPVTAPPAASRSTNDGVGLRNAHDRLRLLFGARASLDLDLSKPAFATARLRIPRES